MKIDDVCFSISAVVAHTDHNNTSVQFARRAEYKALDESDENIELLLRDNPSGELTMGLVAGDENRLRQIITNLAR